MPPLSFSVFSGAAPVWSCIGRGPVGGLAHFDDHGIYVVDVLRVVLEVGEQPGGLESQDGIGKMHPVQFVGFDVRDEIAVKHEVMQARIHQELFRDEASGVRPVRSP